MKCFYHHDTDAVGVCRACGRGLCADCVTDTGRALACPGPCEAEVKSRAARAGLPTPANSGPAPEPALPRGIRGDLVLSAGFSIVLGGIVVVWSYYKVAPFPNIFTWIGGAMALYGIVQGVRAGWPRR